MNQHSDTEMDLLLRRLGRRGGPAVARHADAGAAREQAVSRAHLDADEMSAYVEGALPEAARSLTSAHLADCDACRKIVTGLALASRAEVEEESKPAQTVISIRPSWRSWFAALFTPPVLRYAVPALTLFTVIAIVLVVAIRDGERPSFVARKEEPQKQSANTSVEEKQGVTATTSNSADTGGENHGAPANVNAASGENKDLAEATKPAARPDEKVAATEPAQQERAATPSTGTTSSDAPAVSQPAAPPPAVARTEERQQAAPTMDGVSTADDESNRVKEKDADKLAAQDKRESSEQQRAGSAGGGARSNYPVTGRAARDAKPQESKTDEFGAAKATAGADTAKSSPGASTATPASKRARRDAAGANEDSAETRTVAGHTFRRQNGVWVDSAYSSSRAVTRVKRGSEQYRALTGDEPVVGTIASELGGDVIIVVRGRAYRIY